MQVVVLKKSLHGCIAQNTYNDSEQYYGISIANALEQSS